MTVNSHSPGAPNVNGLLEKVSLDRNGRMYESAVKFTRLYAVFSPTMVALLMAKKTRYGRFIPLPDALPDGFRVTGFGFGRLRRAAGAASQTNGAQNGHPVAASGVVSANGHGKPVAAAAVNGSGRNGAASVQPAARPRQIATARVVEYEIVHRVPGRLRISIPRLAGDAAFARRLSEALAELGPVTRVRVSQPARSAVVEYREPGTSAAARSADPVLAQVLGCIRLAAGGDQLRDLAAQPAAAANPARPARQEKTGEPADRRDVARRMTLPTVSLGLSAGMLAGLAVPPVLMGGVVLLAARPIFARAIEGIRSEKRLTVETLDSTTIVLMASQGIFLSPSIIIGIIEGAQAARDRTARRRSHMSLEQIMPLEPQVFVLAEGADEPMQLAWDEIRPGDVLLLAEGDQIPVDGIALEGSALIDQSHLTGDARPLAVLSGDLVRAGGVLIEGHLRVMAEQTGHDTAVGQAVALIQAGPVGDTRISNYARKVGNWAVVPTLATGGAVYAASGSLMRATGIVNLDLGTGMRVTTPVAVFVTRRRAARLGIELRSGAAIEMLSWADTVVFDAAAAANAPVQVFDRMRELRLELRLVSSGSHDDAQQIAARLGIAQDFVSAALSPEEKAEAVLDLRSAGRRVAFVGHGVDDVAAMAQSDVSVALDGAGALAREAADVVLCNDDLHDLPVAVELARHTVRLLRQDMALVTAANVGAIGYGAVAVFNPIAPLLINNGTWVLATLNSLRPFRPSQIEPN